MIFEHHTDFDSFTNWEWVNFSARELSCKHCGEYWHDPDSLDKLQTARNIVGKPFKINSAHRCEFHNKVVHGAKNSEHLRIAFDISLDGHDKEELLTALFEAGFTTFGMYNSFIHTDHRPWRRWYGCDGVIKKEWQDIYKRVVKNGN